MEQFLRDITQRAGELAFQHFGRAAVRFTKANPADVVTDADLAINKLLGDEIVRAYPTHGIISEEQPELKPDAEYVWIVDPLDGTRNFATRTPLFGVIVALAHRGELELAAIAIPTEHQMYFAKRGGGAFCNGKAIRCSATTAWAYSYGCCGSSQRADKVEPLVRLIRSAADEPFWLSMFGSVAAIAAYVADGRRDWFASFGGAVWDYAGPALLMREAGCIVTNLRGEPWTLADRQMMAAPPALHGELIRRIRG